MSRLTAVFFNCITAGGKELAVLIFLFSFVWPYTKQIITMVLWFAPTNRVTVQTRGSVLLWLDALAKWSIIDVFTLVVTIVAFRVSIKRYDFVLAMLAFDIDRSGHEINLNELHFSQHCAVLTWTFCRRTCTPLNCW